MPLYFLGDSTMNVLPASQAAVRTVAAIVPSAVESINKWIIDAADNGESSIKVMSFGFDDPKLSNNSMMWSPAQQAIAQTFIDAGYTVELATGLNAVPHGDGWGANKEVYLSISW
jgi:hypothetical protein